jgi:MoxR-like ATPase
MFKLKVDYPSKDEEQQILRRAAKTNPDQDVDPVVQPDQILKAQQEVKDMCVDEEVEE